MSCENSKNLECVADTSGLSVIKLWLLWMIYQQKRQTL